ncbi:MAG: response regulator, partial [Treponema sp.]|nr:response regulator [Treponema sp.]
ACFDTASASGEAYRVLALVDVGAFVCAPLYVCGRLWGIISVEQCGASRHWTKNEKKFVTVEAIAIAGVITRDTFNAQLTDALHKAAIASGAKSEFLSNMSHEIRTPLNAITGMTEIGIRAESLEQKDRALDQISGASAHLLGIINDVLDMSKIEANKLELSNIEFDFEETLQRVVNVTSYGINKKKQKLAINIDSNIPKTLIGDDQRLAQVIANLLGNAVKFTPDDGSISFDAVLEKEEDGHCVMRISVSDTGIGINEEQQARLFQSYQQAESGTARKYGGTGLGLVISKRIVEMMGGAIWVRSKPGKGSIFTFTIMIKRGLGERKNGKGMKRQTPARRLCGELRGRRILLAEDMEINREIVTTLLEPLHVEIDCAENGALALQMFAEKPEKYDLVFMDVQMPEMDGYEATRRIRDLNVPRAKNIPIIAMTANIFHEDIDKCIKAGMNGHIGKPLDFKVVVDTLQTYLAA